MNADLLPLLRSALAGRYAVERELGHGGMAVVFLAQDAKHDRQVAIKVLRPELAAALGAERFLREIHVAAQLHHPHILPLYDSGEAASFLYYVMPYMEGETLRDRLERETQLSLEDALQITREVADALSYAHSHDVVHRDIKPENILLESGHAIVADFGIARAITAAGGEKLTETGIAVGTPAYMSPEQGTGASHLDGRSDVYSLGCVLYEMLAGAPPFTGPSAQAILARHSMDPLPSLRTVRSAVPEPVEHAIAKAMGKVPADRFATATQFAEALARPSVPSRRVAQWLRLKWVVAPLVVIGVGVVVWLLSRRGSPVVPAASVIAVLPPAPVTRDTALARLGQNLVVTLSANLNGVGDFRAIDALTVLAQTQGRTADYTLDEAAALGRRLGASGVVSGTLTRDGPNVRLDLGLYATTDAAPVARTFVTASGDDLNALTDSATWALLRQVWRSGAPPSPSLAAVTTHSILALRSFLEGERAIVENRWPDAEQAYARAVQEDSTFWLARWRHAYARWWQMHEVDSAALAPARAHAAELPEPERLLMEAWDDDSVSAFERGRVLTERYPDYWPGWFERADRLFHVGPLFGHPIEQARQGLERTLELNPRLKPAWNHLLGVALTQRDADLQERAVRAHADLGGYPGSDSVFALQDRMNLDVLRGKPFGGARADSFVALTLSFRDPFLQQWSGVWFSSFGYPAMQIEFSRRMLRGGALPGTADAIRQGLAVAWAARGAWDSAMAAIDVYAAQTRDTMAMVNRYRFAVVGVWLGGLEPEVALARRAALVERGGPPERVRWLFAWLDGILAAVRHDSVGLSEARIRLRSGDQAYARSLVGFQLELSGNRRAAAESLYARAWWPSDWRGATFEGINRLAAARWLAADGVLDRAGRLLLWPQANIANPVYWYGVPILDGLTYLEAARIETARGDVPRARKFYEEFLLRYDRPVVSLRHLVEEAQAVLVRLEGRER